MHMDDFLENITQKALKKAQEAAKNGEIPVAAAVFRSADKQILSLCANRTQTDKNPTAHAEMLALQEACACVQSAFLNDCDLYVTLEPCPMCAAAIGFARIRRLYFGAYDVKSGGVEHGPQIYRSSSCHYAPEVYGGFAQKESEQLLKNFFNNLRRQNA